MVNYQVLKRNALSQRVRELSCSQTDKQTDKQTDNAFYLRRSTGFANRSAKYLNFVRISDIFICFCDDHVLKYFLKFCLKFWKSLGVRIVTISRWWTCADDERVSRGFWLRTQTNPSGEELIRVPISFLNWKNPGGGTQHHNENLGRSYRWCEDCVQSAPLHNLGVRRDHPGDKYRCLRSLQWVGWAKTTVLGV